MKPIRSLALVLVVAGLAACAGSGNADPEVTAPLPTVAPTTDDGGPSETDVTTMPNTVAETTTDGAAYRDYDSRRARRLPSR